MFGHTHQNRRRRRNRRLLDVEDGRGQPIVRSNDARTVPAVSQPVVGHVDERHQTSVDGKLIASTQPQTQLHRSVFTCGDGSVHPPGNSIGTAIDNTLKLRTLNVPTTIEPVSFVGRDAAKSLLDVDSQIIPRSVSAPSNIDLFGLSVAGATVHVDSGEPGSVLSQMYRQSYPRNAADVSLGQQWADDLRSYRVAMGFTPVDRFGHLDEHLTALTEAVQSAQRIYDHLNAQLRNSSNTTTTTSIMPVQSTPMCSDSNEAVESHVEAVSALQSEVTPKRPRSHGISLRNILSRRLREPKGAMYTK